MIKSEKALVRKFYEFLLENAIRQKFAPFCCVFIKRYAVFKVSTCAMIFSDPKVQEWTKLDKYQTLDIPDNSLENMIEFHGFWVF